MYVLLLSLVPLERKGTFYVYRVSQQFVRQSENLYRLTGTLSSYRGAQRFVRQSENQNRLTGILSSYRGA